MMKNHPNNNHQMNKKYIKTYFLPYNLHLIQLGNRNNVKNILSNWIHTLIDEASIESTPPSEHHTTFSKKINTVTNSVFIMSKPLHIPRFDTENQEPQFRRIELLIQLRNLLLDYYNFLYDISH